MELKKHLNNAIIIKENRSKNEINTNHRHSLQLNKENAKHYQDQQNLILTRK